MNIGIQGFTGVYRGDRGLQKGICKIAGRLYVNYHEVRGWTRAELHHGLILQYASV